MSEEAKAFVAGVFDRAAADYEHVGVDFFGPVGMLLARHAQAGERVLDVGCGRGASLFPAAERVGAEGFVHGIDLAPGMVRELSADIERRGLTNARATLGDAESLEFPDESFDAVQSGLVLFFVPDMPQAAREIARVLRPGGRLALATFAEDHEEDQALQATLRNLLAPYLPKPPPGSSTQPGALSKLRSRESLNDLLKDFTAVEFTEHLQRIFFPTPEHYWSWLWSSGTRAMMESIPKDVLPEAQHTFTEGVRSLATPEGTLTYTMPIRFTTATRP
ncbi:class I SAM-dependent methyltransferase, partial [Acrocarpospora phusangensis]|uniref:class I SAM-dependent methyltransferase n=1 Tax=Acrocarpospora phusangensis TaxID=1070424 RepID=UPI00194FDFE0